MGFAEYLSVSSSKRHATTVSPVYGLPCSDSLLTRFRNCACDALEHDALKERANCWPCRSLFHTSFLHEKTQETGYRSNISAVAVQVMTSRFDCSIIHQSGGMGSGGHLVHTSKFDSPVAFDHLIGLISKPQEDIKLTLSSIASTATFLGQ